MGKPFSIKIPSYFNFSVNLISRSLYTGVSGYASSMIRSQNLHHDTTKYHRAINCLPSDYLQKCDIDKAFPSRGSVLTSAYSIVHDRLLRNTPGSTFVHISQRSYIEIAPCAPRQKMPSDLHTISTLPTSLRVRLAGTTPISNQLEEIKMSECVRFPRVLAFFTLTILPLL